MHYEKVKKSLSIQEQKNLYNFQIYQCYLKNREAGRNIIPKKSGFYDFLSNGVYGAARQSAPGLPEGSYLSLQKSDQKSDMRLDTERVFNGSAKPFQSAPGRLQFERIIARRDSLDPI